MRTERIDYVLVGGFVLALLAGLIAAVVALSGGRGATDRYFAAYGSVMGIKPGTAVLFQGYPIGEVGAITPAAGPKGAVFRVELDVTRGWKIPEDSVARILASGLISAVVVDIEEGSSPVMLAPGADIRSGEPVNVFQAMSTVAQDVSALTNQGLKPLLDSLNRYTRTLGPVVERDVPRILANLQSVSRQMAAAAPKVTSDILTMSENLKVASTRLRRAAGPANVAAVDRTMANVAKAAADFAKLSAELESTGRQLNQAMGNAQGEGLARSLAGLGQTLRRLNQSALAIGANLESASRNVNALSREIRQSPARLLARPAPLPEER